MRRLGPRCAAWLRPLRRSSAAAAADVTELYVRNLPRSVTTDDVYHAFSAKTEVSNVRLARNRRRVPPLGTPLLGPPLRAARSPSASTTRSSNSRPFAFVTVAGAAHLWHKKALSEFRCGDYELLVQVAQNPTKDPVHKEHPRTIEVRVDPAWQAMQLNVRAPASCVAKGCGTVAGRCCRREHRGSMYTPGGAAVAFGGYCAERVPGRLAP
ncbi:hypothetical protein M885DRAFT_235888 [Pelagophyceae sp. CCMP2097]|nr:hypothetical protein M885DRAFT_235888 [Pelagophyceae sp. CCMP2097]